MRERLELLQRLLRQDGVLFVQLNDNEVRTEGPSATRCLAVQILLNQVSVKMKQTAGASGGGEDKRLKKNIESPPYLCP